MKFGSPTVAVLSPWHRSTEAKTVRRGEVFVLSAAPASFEAHGQRRGVAPPASPRYFEGNWRD